MAKGDSIQIQKADQKHFKQVLEGIVRKCGGVVKDAQFLVGISDGTYYGFVNDERGDSYAVGKR